MLEPFIQYSTVNLKPLHLSKCSADRFSFVESLCGLQSEQSTPTGPDPETQMLVEGDRCSDSQHLLGKPHHCEQLLLFICFQMFGILSPLIWNLIWEFSVGVFPSTMLTWFIPFCHHTHNSGPRQPVLTVSLRSNICKEQLLYNLILLWKCDLISLNLNCV